MIGYSIFAFNKKTPFPSLYTLIPTIGAGMIIVFASSRTIVGRLLSAKLLVAIGLISYSAYLWHQPLLAYVRYKALFEPSKTVYVIILFTSLLLAHLSYVYVEKPFRDKNRFSRKLIFGFALTGSILLFAIGMGGYITNGFEQRSIYQRLSVANYQPDNRLLQQQTWTNLRKLSGTNNYGGENNDFDRTLWYQAKDGRRRLLVVGNSHSKDLYNVLRHSVFANRHFQIARFGIQVSDMLDEASGFFSSPNYMQSDIVMVASRYSKNDLSSMESIVKKILKDNKTVVIAKNIFEFYYHNGKNTADVLLQQMLQKGLIADDVSAVSAVDKIDKAYYREFFSKDKSNLIQNSDAVIDSIKNKYEDVIVLDRMDYVCDKKAERCFSINQKLEKFFYDYGHHTLDGSIFFGKRIDQIGWLESLPSKMRGRRDKQ
jgi:hypothetical protein